jgi:polysaccharide deacetylase family protein (PEP-CTERM system associated)
MKMNFVTFDIEEWYAANYGSVDLSRFSDSSSHLERGVDRLIDICAQAEVTSTCFVVGDIARDKPHIVKKLHRAGHEIASHSFAHELVYNMTPEAFAADLKLSCNHLEQIIGEKVIGFRAPSWSVKMDTLTWFYEALQQQGILYSSSVFPGKTYLYGIPNFPEKIHQPTISGIEQKVWEIPQTLFSIAGKKFGFSGGFYLRALPLWFILQMMERKNAAAKSVFLYLHPREIDPQAPKLQLPLLERFIHYYGVAGCEGKFTKILQHFKGTFMVMGDYIRQLTVENEMNGEPTTHENQTIYAFENR